MNDIEKPKFRQFLEIFGILTAVLSIMAMLLWGCSTFGPSVLLFLFTDLPRGIITWATANPLLALVIGIVLAAAGLAWFAVYYTPQEKQSEKRKNDQAVKLADDGELLPEVAEQVKRSAES